MGFLEPRDKRKSLQKGITDDFLTFIKQSKIDDLSSDSRKDVEFIVENYLKIFLDKIKLKNINEKILNLTDKEKFITMPSYDNYSQHTSNIFFDVSFFGTAQEKFYSEIFKIILDVLAMLEAKKYFSNDCFVKLSKDHKKFINLGINLVNNLVKKWLPAGKKIDQEFLIMFSQAYDFSKSEVGDIFNFSDPEDLVVVMNYFQSDFEIDPMQDDCEKVFCSGFPSFKDITKFDLDDTILEFIIPLIKFLLESQSLHIATFKPRITPPEKEPIDDFLYQVDVFFKLGIKKEINDGVFYGLIIDGFLELNQKTGLRKNH